MKTLERYVFGSFLTSFILAFLVLSFVLTIGLLVQIVEFIMDGVPMDLVGEFCMVSLPETMQWSIPLALLVSSILVFSRMSADSEIAAMRSCGINLLTIVRWPLIFAVLCTLLGFFVNNEIVTRGHRMRRTLKARVSVGAGLSVLKPGEVIDDFRNVKLYFRAKEGNWLYDLRARDDTRKEVSRFITADKALVTQNGQDINLDLYGMTVDPLDDQHPTMARFDRFVYTIKDALKGGKYHPGIKDMTAAEMRRAMSAKRQAAKAKAGRSDREREFARRELSQMRVEISKRYVFAMASICFVLVGIPLGIRSQRKESTIGMAISLAVSLGYYVVVILMLSMKNHYRIHPELILWLPVLACLVLSAKLMRKHL